MRPGAKIIAAGVVAALALGVWSARLRIASGLADRKLADARVPGSYRFTRIGPFSERLEDVRIGNPEAPDLVARRIDVTLGYALSGPFVRAVEIEGARLRARITANGLSLGAIDRLMPASKAGGAVLPDLEITLRDAQVILDTPNGQARAVIAGSGNPADTFRGTARITADALRVASCRFRRVTANFDLSAGSRAPAIAGPVDVGHVDCPGQALSRGTARLTVSGDPAFQRIAFRAALDGFGGRAGPARFDRLNAAVSGAGKLGKLDGDADVSLHSLSLPGAEHAVSAHSASLGGTPLGPTFARASAAVAALLANAEAEARVSFGVRGEGAAVRLHRLAMTGKGGAQVTAVERGGMSWSAAGWQADGDVATAGGGLPEMMLALRQLAPGAPLVANGTLKPYRAGNATLAASPVRLRWDGNGLRFATIARIDGPLGSGLVEGLTAPLDGLVRPSGAFVAGEGCRPVEIRGLRLASYTFGAARTEVCGAPIVASDPGGLVRVAMNIGPVRLTGRSASGQAAALAATQLRLSGQHLSVAGMVASLGAAERTTRLEIPSLEGDILHGGLSGGFERASAAIANVPLDLGDISGKWSFAGRDLRLDGALQVRDADPSPRFLPLRAENASLVLHDETVTARADLLEPTMRALVAKVTIDHDLGRGSGQALLTVPGIRFVPKGLQPEKLTPFTLGVIADVAGTVTGRGRIAWSDGSVASSGTFATDRIDLAAAFGPVGGIKGELRFTDLLGLVSAADQQASIAEINPGVVVGNGVVHYQFIGGNRVSILGATWPFAGGTLRLEPSVLNLSSDGERRLTFRVDGLDAAAFVQQLDFPNIAATGIFDGKLPMIFDQQGGRIENGSIVARPGGGSVAYIGEVSNAELGTMGKMAFDALKAIRYSSLDIALDGRLDGEIVSRVRFTGVREATAERNLVGRMIRNLPFRFDIQIRAPFRGLVGSARSYIDPRLLLTQLPVKSPAVQPSASGDGQ